MKKLFTLLLCAAMTMSMWAENPSWLKPGDEWDDATKTLTVNSDLENSAYAENKDILHVIIKEGVETIGTQAFDRCFNITSVEMPNSLISIGESAFNYCSKITSIDIPNNVESIGQDAFARCYALASVTIGDGVETIGMQAFYGCTSLTSLTIGNSVQSISSRAFWSCSVLTSVEIPNSVKSIGAQAFYACYKIASLTIGNSVQSIYESAFFNCYALTSVEIPNSVKTIGENAFDGCSKIASLTIGNSVTSIGSYAFNGCSALTSVEIPNSVETIGIQAFCYCTALASVTIGSGVTSMGNYAFYNCPALTDVICGAVNPPTINIGVLNNCAALKHIYVPDVSVQTYKEDGGWQEYASKIRSAIQVVGDTITYTYKDNTLYYEITKKNESGKEVKVVNEGLPSYWTYAHKPTGKVVIPDSIEDFMGTKYGVTKTGYEAFRECTGITFIDFSENTHITTTSGAMCDGCTSLTSVILSDYITTIMSYGFRECPLSAIDLKNVKAIGMSNFEASTFTTVHIPASLEKIEDQSYLCYHATTVTCAAENTHFAAVDNVLYNKELTKVIALPCGYTAEQEVHLPPTVTSMAFSALRDFTGKLYINSEITCNDTGWRNSPIGAVVVGCGLLDYYTTGDYEAGDNCNFRYVASLTDSLLWNVTATADGHATVTLTDTTDCNTVGVAVSNIESGYTFVNWSNGATTESTTYTVTSDMTIRANVKKNLVVGDIFYAPTEEGVSVLYKVLTNAAGDKTVQVGDYSTMDAPNAISASTTGVVTIPDSAVYYDEKFEVVLIADYAFNTCNNVSTLNLPNTIKEIKPLGVSEMTGLTAVNIPNTLERTGRYNFSYMNSLQSITLPSTIKYIDYGTFFACDLLETINGWDPAKIERMGYNTISSLTPKIWNNTDYVQVDGGFRYMGDILFMLPGYETITIPEGARIIARGTGIVACKNIDIPSTVEALSSGLIYQCPILETCTIKAVTPPLIYNAYDVSIEEDATWLRAYFASTYPQWGSDPTPADVRYYVPKAALATYQANDKWNMLDLRPIGGWTVTFKDGQTGADIAVKNADTNGSVEAPDAPVHAGYKFNGWDSDAYQNVTGDLTIIATYVSDPTGLENIETISALKTLRDGQILILRGDKVYTITGQELK